MFSFDIETLDLESTAIILSIGAVYYDGVSNLTYQGLIDSSIFVKLDVREQVKNLGRTKNRDTMDWWAKQSSEAKRISLLPSDTDVSAGDALDIVTRWFKTKPDYKNDVIWSRGHLDQMCIESLMRVTGKSPFISHASWRETRTAIECMYEKSKNGYVAVDTSLISDYDENRVIRHHPVHDATNDMCMLVGGVQ